MRNLTPRVLFSTIFFVLFFTISSNNIYAQCADPDTFTNECGDVFDLCKDTVFAFVNIPIDISITANDALGIFDPCDLAFAAGSSPWNGEVVKLSPADDCVFRYTANAFTEELDSFDYVLRLRSSCEPEYCQSGQGKIWTMNNAYYGPSGATVTVSSKNVVFATITDLTNGHDFFINGKDLPNSNSNWTFRFYFDGDTDSTPDEVADVHTSCSALVFGEDFGIFSPIAGCVATQSDKANCSEADLSALSGAQFRVINEVSVTEIFDTTTVYIYLIELGSLPIDFTHISGRGVGTDNLISWGIESVVGEDRMILQKSNDGETYSDLEYYTDLKAGQFQYLDTNVKSKRSYYRFKIISFDGLATYSRAITISNKKLNSGDINIFPAPTTDIINFEAQDKIVNLEIINLAGQNIFSQTFETQNLSLDLRSYVATSGIYIARIKLENNQIITKKISLVD